VDSLIEDQKRYFNPFTGNKSQVVEG